MRRVRGRAASWPMPVLSTDAVNATRHAPVPPGHMPPPPTATACDTPHRVTGRSPGTGGAGAMRCGSHRTLCTARAQTGSCAPYRACTTRVVHPTHDARVATHTHPPTHPPPTHLQSTANPPAQHTAHNTCARIKHSPSVHDSVASAQIQRARASVIGTTTTMTDTGGKQGLTAAAKRLDVDRGPGAIHLAGRRGAGRPVAFARGQPGRTTRGRTARGQSLAGRTGHVASLRAGALGSRRRGARVEGALGAPHGILAVCRIRTRSRRQVWRRRRQVCRGRRQAWCGRRQVRRGHSVWRDVRTPGDAVDGRGSARSKERTHGAIQPDKHGARSRWYA